MSGGLIEEGEESPLVVESFGDHSSKSHANNLSNKDLSFGKHTHISDMKQSQYSPNTTALHKQHKKSEGNLRSPFTATYQAAS